MRGLNDTSAAGERVVIETYRRMSIQRKWQQMGEIFHTAKVLHAAGVRLRKPAATTSEIEDDWFIQTLGVDVWHAVKEAVRGCNR